MQIKSLFPVGFVAFFTLLFGCQSENGSHLCENEKTLLGLNDSLIEIEFDNTISINKMLGKAKQRISDSCEHGNKCIVNFGANIRMVCELPQTCQVPMIVKDYDRIVSININKIGVYLIEGEIVEYDSLNAIIWNLLNDEFNKNQFEIRWKKNVPKSAVQHLMKVIHDEILNTHKSRFYKPICDSKKTEIDTYKGTSTIKITLLSPFQIHLNKIVTLDSIDDSTIPPIVPQKVITIEDVNQYNHIKDLSLKTAKHIMENQEKYEFVWNFNEMDSSTFQVHDVNLFPALKNQTVVTIDGFTGCSAGCSGKLLMVFEGDELHYVKQTAIDVKFHDYNHDGVHEILTHNYIMWMGECNQYLSYYALSPKKSLWSIGNHDYETCGTDEDLNPGDTISKSSIVTFNDTDNDGIDELLLSTKFKLKGNDEQFEKLDTISLK